ncbi:MAG: DUF58 domain-containing protein [Lachnospiraceae bacterium]|nr:DUF58 domain-containing protein [Lachnospiraceae bacterium]
MRERIIYIIIALSSVIFYIFANNQSALLLMLIVVLMGPIAILINYLSVRGLRIDVNIYKQEETGYFTVDLNIKNKSFLPIFRIRTAISVRNMLTLSGFNMPLELAIAPGKELKKSIVFESKYCGRIEVDTDKAYSYDFLGLTKREIKVKSSKGLYAYPNLTGEHMDLLDNVSKDELNIQNRYTHVRGNDITQILDIRDYEKGDNIKTIHWKLSGKLGRKLVKELDTPASQDTIIMIALSDNAAAKPDMIDRLAGTVLQLSKELLKEQVFFDAVLMRESSGHSSLYTVQEKNAADWYEKRLLDGDLEFKKDRLEEYISYNRVFSRYSSVILVTDSELEGIFDDVRQVYQICL